MTLIEAWQLREKMWKEGSGFIERGNTLWREIVSLPGSAKVMVWFSFSEMSCEAADLVSTGYARRLEADRLWCDALMESKGKDVKVKWEYVEEKKSNRCTLSTGEVFEP